jgi:acetyltransferase-like isoleucine patch superfamily enzyme
VKELIKRRLKILIADPRGSIFWRLDDIAQSVNTVPSTWVAYGLAWLWGVDIARACRFYGVTEFKRYPLSSIQIGAHCVFRSAFRSNWAGLNRPCALSTHRKHARIIIGAHSGFSGTVIGAAEQITIGQHVFCGANSMITDFDWHAISPEARYTGGKVGSAPVLIEDNVWLGLNTVVLKGVRIGENSVIGANSVVVSSIPANVIAAGNPAKVIRSLS